MAEQKYYTIVTDLGTELIAKAAEAGEKVNITNIAVGDGNGAFYQPTSDMTTLKREIWRGEIQSYERDSLAKNIIKVSGVIPKDIGHFVLREMALFDDKNNMIAICNAPDLLKAVLEDGALTEAVVYMRIAVTNTESVTIQVNSSVVYATLQELEAHKKDENAHQELFEQKADKTELETGLAGKIDATIFTTELNKKANKTEVETALAGKVDTATFTTELNKKADKITMTTELNKKVDKTDFTGTNIGNLLEQAGWSSGAVINNIVDGEKEGSIKQINATVTGTNASAFGQSEASGANAFAEGKECVASGWYSHAEGQGTIASGFSSHAEASGNCSHAEGCGTKASGPFSHAEGYETVASALEAHAEGIRTIASGSSSHAEGMDTQAKSTCAHAGGYLTIANAYQTVIGKLNTEVAGGSSNYSTGSAFIIGNGTSTSSGATRSNCFRVQFDGNTFAKGVYNSSGADYAEMFEWLDKNVDHEDRVGLFVALDGDKVRIATSEDDNILGVVSACPSVCGDVKDETWGDIYLKDIYGRLLLEEIEVPEITETIMLSKNDSDKPMLKTIQEAHKEIVPKLNPDYDPTRVYIPRSQRPEWVAIGMLGKLVVMDDGSCKVKGWCKAGKNGIATIAKEKQGYYVMDRLDKNHIKILFR